MLIEIFLTRRHMILNANLCTIQQVSNLHLAYTLVWIWFMHTSYGQFAHLISFKHSTQQYVHFRYRIAIADVTYGFAIFIHITAP